jgi:hypothetical protein
MMRKVIVTGRLDWSGTVKVLRGMARVIGIDNDMRQKFGAEARPKTRDDLIANITDTNITTRYPMQRA